MYHRINNFDLAYVCNMYKDSVTDNLKLNKSDEHHGLLSYHGRAEKAVYYMEEKCCKLVIMVPTPNSIL